MLQIDAEGIKTGLMEALYAECETLTNWLWMQVQGEAPPEVDRSQVYQNVVVTGTEVLGTIIAGGMGALITEWGSGSLADTSNPAWGGYTHSQYWNPLRDPGKHTIRGRPAGTYVDLDNETHVSSGKMAGKNVEWRYSPHEPEHWMRGIVALSRPYIFERLSDMVRMFPFYKYIRGDGR